MKKDLVIAVTGTHGFVGSALVARFRAQGHTVLALPREIGLLPGCDVLIHLGGESPAGYWTARKRRAIYNSRVLSTRRLVSRLPDAVSLPKVFLCASAVGFYGHRPGEPLDETSGPGRGFRTDTCVDWEFEAMKAEALGIRTVRLRFGTILDPSGGYLGRMLPFLRRGLCFVLGNPEDRFSWISLEDALRMIEFAMVRETVSGALNVVAPVAATQAAFARAAARLAGRRVIGQLRPGLLRAGLGELASAIVDVQDVAPAKALQEGFGHVHPTLQFWISSREKPEMEPVLEKAS
jgi:uncharacterized protein (TIGR01777 family)